MWIWLQSTRVMVAELPCDDDGGSFSATAWVNAALRDGVEESLDMHLSVLLTKLQIAAADADAEIQQVALELAAVAPKLAREIGALREQASALRSELNSLTIEAQAISERSEGSVAVLRETLSAQRRLASVCETLASAERVSQQLLSAEAAFERGELADSATHVSELSESLGALGSRGGELFPTAGSRLDRLRASLLEVLQPALLRAVAEQDAEAMRGHVRVYRALGCEEKVRTCCVECRQGPIFEQWNAAKRGADPAAGGEVSGGMTTFWGFLVSYTRGEQAWIASVFPGEEAMLPALLVDALGSLKPQMEALLLAALAAKPNVQPGISGEAAAGSAFPIFYVSEQAVACSAAVGGLLGGVHSVSVQEAILEPFDEVRTV